jgi:predicted O-methyltransferase YrrM
MQYQLVPDDPAEEAALSAHPTVRTLFDPFLPVLQARSIMAGVRLGIFGAIGREVRMLDDLASDLSLDADALKLMMRVLTCAGYVSCEDGRYRLTELASMTLLPDSPARLSAWVQFNYVHWRIIARLEEVLQTGEGIEPHRCLEGEADWAVQQRAMLETARPAASWVAGQVPVRSGARTMLDVGGSHGLYGAMICRAHPPLRSEVIELPEAIDHARSLAREEGIDDVVTHRAGDVLTDDLGRHSCDLVFLGNVVHHFTMEQNQDLFRRIRAALRAEGTVAVWDFRQPDAAAAPDLVGDGLALLFRISSGGRCYTPDEIVEWLKSAGFDDIRIHPTPTPAQILITGRAS